TIYITIWFRRLKKEGKWESRRVGAYPKSLCRGFNLKNMKKENLLQFGWLILRVGIGISIFLHGFPKITGGTEMWTAIGSSMGIFGINFAPTFWGFLAAVAESVGGLLFAL